MSNKPESLQEELFRMAQELGEVDIIDEAPIVTVEEPVVDWTTPAPVAEAIPDDLFAKAYKDLDAILVHLQKTMNWPAYQVPWEKQRLSILTAYGMTVEGFYAELSRRNEAKRKLAAEAKAAEEPEEFISTPDQA